MRELIVPEGLSVGFAVVVHSQSDAEELLAALDTAGFKWVGGVKLTKYSHYDKSTNGAIVYYVATLKNGGYVQFAGSGKYSSVHGYDLFDYDDIMCEQITESEEMELAIAFEEMLKI